MKKNLLVLGFAALTSVLAAQTPRLSLFEEFTGETCPPCASTNPGLNALLAAPNNTPNVVAIKWQVPIPSAPTKTWSLYQTNKAEIDWRYATYGYGVNSAPTGRMDGQSPMVFGASSDHPVTLNSTVIATAQSYTSAFSVTMSRAWNVGCTAVDLTVSIQATANFTASGALKFRTVMVERLIQFSVQPGTNGETIFEDVAIKSFPSIQAGMPMAGTWTVGQTQTFTLNCPLPSYTRKKSEVAFVGFIQDDGNRKVAQAVRVGTAAVPTESLAALGASVNLSCNNSITPTITVKNVGPNALSTFTVNPYADSFIGSPTVWNGNLAVGAQTTMVLSPLSIASASATGAHTFSFSVDLTAPQYNLEVSLNKAPYYIASDYQGTPVSEGFAAAAFPPAKWGVVNNDFGPGWSRNTLAGGFNQSTESIKYDFYNNTVMGDEDALYLPAMDLTGSNPDPTLTFDVAYATRDAASSDMLQVFVSDNCGGAWTKVYDKAGMALATFTDAVSNAYIPDPFESGHWRKETVILPGFNKPQVLTKFVTTNTQGNNLYLDNVNLTKEIIIGLNETTKTASQVSIHPNPNSGEFGLYLQGTVKENAAVAIYNSLGQLVYSNTVLLGEGSSKMALDLKGVATGVYTVIIDAEHIHARTKMILR